MQRRRTLSRVLVPLVSLALVVIAAEAPVDAKKKPKKSEVSLSDQLQLAQSLMDAGRVGDSLAVVNEALKQNPQNASIHALKGKLTFQAGKYPEAEASFRKALEIDAYMTDAHNYLGVTLAQLGRYGEAEAEYKRALEDAAYPTPENVYLNLGILYATQKRDDEAVVALRRAVEINPRFYKGHFELAAVLDRQGNVEEAAREYEVASPAYRSVGDFYYRLGFAYFRLGHVDRARDSLNRAIQVAPGSPSAAQADELLRMIPE
jgi:Tfp pilus assembly protein PilF